MSTATESIEVAPADQLAKFRQQDAVIAKMSAEYSLLTIAGIDDKRGLALVHSARMEVRNCRVDVEKLRKRLKEDSLSYGRRVDAEAKRITALLEPIESRLQDQEDAVAAEKERIREEAEAAKLKILQARIGALTALGVGRFGTALNPLEVQGWTEQQFQDALSDAQADADKRARIEAEAAAYRQQQEEAAVAERARLARVHQQEQEALKAERARLDEIRQQQESEAAAERAKIEAVRKQQEAEAAKLAAEKRRLENEAEAQRRAAELEEAKRAAGARAVAETKRKIAEQAAREQAKKDAAEARRLKAEAERPHRERLATIADAVLAIAVPEGPGRQRVLGVLDLAAEQIREIASGPLTEVLESAEANS